MTNIQFETVDVPAGAYIGWAPNPGQTVVGKVLAYQQAGGTDFGGDPCPQLSLELLEPAFSVNKMGDRTDFNTGDLVVINAGLANLKRNVVAAQPQAGDVVKIEFTSLERSANGQVKVFKIGIARGAGKNLPTPPSAGQAAQVEAQPPF